LISRYREEIGEGHGVDEAMGISIGTSGVALILATLTTVIGFLTNITNPVPALKDFGILAAVGLAYSFLRIMHFVPSLPHPLDPRAGPEGLRHPRRSGHRLLLPPDDALRSVDPGPPRPPGRTEGNPARRGDGDRRRTPPPQADGSDCGHRRAHSLRGPGPGSRARRLRLLGLHPARHPVQLHRLPPRGRPRRADDGAAPERVRGRLRGTD